MSAGPPRQARVDSPARLRVRKRALDRIAVWSLLVVFLAVSMPWLLRAEAQSLGGPARAALAYLVLYQVLAMLGDRVKGRPSMLVALGALQASLLVFLALLWGWLGGLTKPALLIGFGIPVGALAVLLGRRAALGAAVVSVAAVAAVALGQSSGLRWYVARAGFPAAELFAPVGALAGASPAPGGGTPSEQFAALSAFAVLLVAWALVSHGAAALALRAASLAERVTGAEEVLASAAVSALREPIVVVEVETGLVAQASRGFTLQMLLHGQALTGRDLFELLQFDDPTAVRRLLAEGGEIEFCGYRADGEARVDRLVAHRVAHRGAAYAWLGFRERTELWWLRSALDASDEATLVIASDGRLRYASTAASALLGELYPGLEAQVALAGAGLGGDWWRVTETAERRVELEGRSFRGRCTPLPIQTRAGSETAWLLSLRPDQPGSRP